MKFYRRRAVTVVIISFHLNNNICAKDISETVTFW